MELEPQSEREMAEAESKLQFLKIKLFSASTICCELEFVLRHTFDCIIFCAAVASFTTLHFGNYGDTVIRSKKFIANGLCAFASTFNAMKLLVELVIVAPLFPNKLLTPLCFFREARRHYFL